MITILTGWYAFRPLALRVTLLCAVAALAAGCGLTSNGEDEAPRREVVVAPLYPLAFAASRLAPPLPVMDLQLSGEDAHGLDLSATDAERLRDARLVVYLGRGFQPAVEDAVAGRTLPSLDALTAVRPLPAGPGEALLADPHIWLDPVRFASVARAIATTLGRDGSADRFVLELQALDGEIERGLADCDRRTIVTTHTAFAYLADRYDLDQVGLAGLEPEVEPGPATIARLVDEVRSSGATTVFTEPLASGAIAALVAREAGIATAVLDPIEGLTETQRLAGEDYFTVMRRNLASLREALGCR